MGRAALWALVACAWATASTPPPQSIDVLEVADAGRITGRAVAPESGDDVEVVFDLRGASEDEDGSPVFADVSWRRRRAPHAMRAEAPVASVRLEEPFAVRTRVDHELLVRRRDTGGVLAHVDVRAARAGSAGDATRGVWDGGRNASEGRVRLRGGEVARARRSRRPRAFVGPVEHPPLRVGEDCEEKSSDRACARAKLLDKRLHAMKIAEIEDRVAFTDAQLARAAQEKDALEAERRLSAAAARWDRVAAYGPSPAGLRAFLGALGGTFLLIGCWLTFARFVRKRPPPRHKRPVAFVEDSDGAPSAAATPAASASGSSPLSPGAPSPASSRTATSPESAASPSDVTRAKALLGKLRAAARLRCVDGCELACAEIDFLLAEVAAKRVAARAGRRGWQHALLEDEARAVAAALPAWAAVEARVDAAADVESLEAAMAAAAAAGFSSKTTAMKRAKKRLKGLLDDLRGEVDAGGGSDDSDDDDARDAPAPRAPEAPEAPEAPAPEAPAAPAACLPHAQSSPRGERPLEVLAGRAAMQPTQELMEPRAVPICHEASSTRDKITAFQARIKPQSQPIHPCSRDGPSRPDVAEVGERKAARTRASMLDWVMASLARQR